MFQVGKMKFHRFWPHWRHLFGYSWKIHYCSLWKKSLQRPWLLCFRPTHGPCRNTRRPLRTFARCVDETHWRSTVCSLLCLLLRRSEKHVWIAAVLKLISNLWTSNFVCGRKNGSRFENTTPQRHGSPRMLSLNFENFPVTQPANQQQCRRQMMMQACRLAASSFHSCAETPRIVSCNCIKKQLLFQ